MSKQISLSSGVEYELVGLIFFFSTGAWFRSYSFLVFSSFTGSGSDLSSSFVSCAAYSFIYLSTILPNFTLASSSLFFLTILHLHILDICSVLLFQLGDVFWAGCYRPVLLRNTFPQNNCSAANMPRNSTGFPLFRVCGYPWK